MCESSAGTTAAGVLAFAALTAVFLALPILLIVRAHDHRGLATAVWLGALVLGAGPAFAGGDDGVLLRWGAGVTVAIVASVTVAAMRGRPVLGVVGVLGATAPAAIALIGGIAVVLVSDECFH